MANLPPSSLDDIDDQLPLLPQSSLVSPEKSEIHTEIFRQTLTFQDPQSAEALAETNRTNRSYVIVETGVQQRQRVQELISHIKSNLSAEELARIGPQLKELNNQVVQLEGIAINPHLKIMPQMGKSMRPIKLLLANLLKEVHEIDLQGAPMPWFLDNLNLLVTIHKHVDHALQQLHNLEQEQDQELAEVPDQDQEAEELQGVQERNIEGITEESLQTLNNCLQQAIALGELALAEQIAHRIPDAESQTNALAIILIAYAKQGDPSRAEAIAISMPSEEIQMAAYTQIAIALISLAKNRILQREESRKQEEEVKEGHPLLAKALSYIDTILELDSSESLRHSSNALADIAKELIPTFIPQALELLNKPMRNSAKANILTLLMEHYLSIGNLDKAIEYASKIPKADAMLHQLKTIVDNAPLNDRHIKKILNSLASLPFLSEVTFIERRHALIQSIITTHWPLVIEEMTQTVNPNIVMIEECVFHACDLGDLTLAEQLARKITEPANLDHALSKICTHYVLAGDNEKAFILSKDLLTETSKANLFRFMMHLSVKQAQEQREQAGIMQTSGDKSLAEEEIKDSSASIEMALQSADRLLQLNPAHFTSYSEEIFNLAKMMIPQFLDQALSLLPKITSAYQIELLSLAADHYQSISEFDKAIKLIINTPSSRQLEHLHEILKSGSKLTNAQITQIWDVLVKAQNPHKKNWVDLKKKIFDQLVKRHWSVISAHLNAQESKEREANLSNLFIDFPESELKSFKDLMRTSIFK